MDTNILNQEIIPNPGVILRRGDRESMIDIYTRLLEDRIVFLGTSINSTSANLIVAQLLYLYHEDPDRDIQMYINSPGGHVTAGLAIYDTMRMIRSPISTVAVGMAASFATVLLTAGTKGRRYALPHATIHLHQPLGGAEGQATDIAIAAKEIMRNKAVLNQILSDHTGKPIDVIEKDTDRDYYLDAKGAVDYGIIDQVLEMPEPLATKVKA